MLAMTQADIDDTVATAMLDTQVNSAAAWTTLYTRDKVPTQVTVHPGCDTMPVGWDDSTHDPRMEAVK